MTAHRRDYGWERPAYGDTYRSDYGRFDYWVQSQGPSRFSILTSAPWVCRRAARKEGLDRARKTGLHLLKGLSDMLTVFGQLSSRQHQHCATKPLPTNSKGKDDNESPTGGNGASVVDDGNAGCPQ
jgi:hypothetical protein